MKRLDDAPGDQDRIGRRVLGRRVIVLAQHLEFEGIDRGQHRPRAHREVAERNAREVLHAEHGGDRELLEQAVANHAIATAFLVAGFLGGLEDEVDGAVEVPRPGEVFGGAEQHRGVDVMAASMHLAVVCRAVREIVLLVEKQRVHVRPQTDRSVARPALQRADDAGAGEAAVDLETEPAEPLGDQVGGPILGERGLGMGMDIAPPGGQFGAHLLDLSRHGHHLSPVKLMAPRITRRGVPATSLGPRVRPPGLHRRAQRFGRAPVSGLGAAGVAKRRERARVVAPGLGAEWLLAQAFGQQRARLPQAPRLERRRDQQLREQVALGVAAADPPQLMAGRGEEDRPLGSRRPHS